MMWFIPKNKKAILSLTAVLCLSLGFMAGCKEEAPPAKTAVVKKRIEQTPQTAKVTETEKTTPTAETAGAKATATEEKAAPTAEAAGSKATEATAASESTAPKAEKPASSAAETTPATATAQKEKAAAPPKTAPGETAAAKDAGQEENVGVAGEAEETEAVSLKSSLLDNTFPKYDPTGKVDPFLALFSQESEADLSGDTEPKRPLTPLERVDISQLKLSAIILAESGGKAMVVDATGKPYVLSLGTYVGVNSGTVTKILKDRVVIEETTRDFLGRESTNTRELKLQKPFGEE